MKILDTNIFKTKIKFTYAPALIWRDPLCFVAFGFGVGAIPLAPGTFGTLLAIPFWLLLVKLPLWLYLFVVLASFAIACWICEKASAKIGEHDHAGMVIDEIVGFWITMIAVPAKWHWIILGFLLFRVFDMLKPWPIHIADQRIGGGFGIMFDDLLAALYAGFCLQVLLFFFH